MMEAMNLALFLLFSSTCSSCGRFEASGNFALRQLLIDATLGGGGHNALLLEQHPAA